MPITQINPPLPMMTPLGEAWAHFIWCDGLETNVHFGCFQTETGENWWWENDKVRLCKNISVGHVNLSAIRPVPGLEPHLERHGIASTPPHEAMRAG